MTTGPLAGDATWVRRYHPAPSSGVRLACFAHAGGSASFYFPVSRALAPAVEVLAIQYPGRQDRRTDANIDNVPDLADRIFAALRPYDDRPLAFFGHSMGAVLAYEVGLRLEASGGSLAHLFASGRRAPSRYRSETVHQRDDAGLIAELHKLAGTDSAILGDPELLEMVLPAIKSDYKAIETYRHTPGRRLRCPMTALVGDDDPRTSIDEGKAWAEHTDGPFDLRVFPGGHFYLVEQSAAVISLVSERLAAGDRPAGR